MDRARPGGRQAHTDLTGEFCMAACHERRHLFVPRLDELHPVGGALERAHDAVDSVTGVAVHTADTPVMQALNQEIGNSLSHGTPLESRICCKRPAACTSAITE